MSTLAELGLGTPDGRSAAAGSLYFAAPSSAGGPVEVWRLNAATAVLDVKRRLEMNTADTAYGPTTNTRVRELLLRLGVAPGELPKPSAQWRSAENIPASVLRVLVWLAYCQPTGVPLSAVVLDRVSRGPQWGVRAPGGRVEVVRAPVGGGASVSVSVGGASASVDTSSTGSSSSSTGSSSSSTGSSSSSTGSSSSSTGSSSTENRVDEGGSSTGSSSSASSAGGRVVTMPGAWHLRTSAVASNAGARAYPGGESVRLIEPAPSMVRGPSERGYRVHVVSDDREGFAFVPVSVLDGVAADVARGVGGVIADSVGSGVMLALKVAAGLAVAGVAVAGVVVLASRGRAPAAPSGMGYRPAMPPPPPAPLPAPPRASRPSPPPTRAGEFTSPARRFKRVA